MGVPPHASISEIRTAYQQKAFLYHPDQQQQQHYTNDLERIQCHEQLTNIHQAYELLSDPHRRYQYDTVQQERERRSASTRTSPSSSMLRRTTTKPSSKDLEEENPFSLLDKFVQEFGADIFGPSFPKDKDDHPHHSKSNNENVNHPNKDPFASLFPAPSSSSPFSRNSGRFHQDRFPLSTVSFHELFQQQEAMMKRMEQEILQQQEQEQHQAEEFNNKNQKNPTRRYYSCSSSSTSSSSSTRKDPTTGEWITTTTQTIQNNHGQPSQTVQETIVYHPDGTIKERIVTGNEALLQQRNTVSSTSPSWWGPHHHHHKALENHHHHHSDPSNSNPPTTNQDHSKSNKSWWSTLFWKNNPTKEENHPDRPKE